MSFEVVDNFLDEETYKTIGNAMLSGNFPWYYLYGVSGMGEDSYNVMFTHNFYSGCQTMSSHFNNMIMPLLNKFPRVKSLIRVKGNLYPKTDILYHHNDHIDMDFDHKGAIYYVNSNNGFTVIGDQKIESVANRMLFFNPQVLHHSTTCTNEYARVNINFNYF